MENDSKKEKGWVGNFLDRVMAIQANVLYDIPEEKRQQGYGRAAKMIVDGPGGGIFEFWFSEKLEPKPPDVPIKNTVYMSEDTLLNLITPDVDLDTLVSLIKRTGGVKEAISQLYPRLDFRTALANRLITISGDTADVDSEEWAQLIEKAVLKIGFPIVIRGMLRKAREKK